MKTFKGHVANKAWLEGCIVQGYIQEETLTYCTRYKAWSNANISKKIEKVFDESNLLRLNLFDENDNNLISLESGPIGKNLLLKVLSMSKLIDG